MSTSNGLDNVPVIHTATLSRSAALQGILDTHGRFFAVRFIKADGSLREMNCRTGAGLAMVKTPTLDEQGNPTLVTYNSADDLVRVWSMQDKGFRSFKLARLTEIKLPGGEWMNVVD